MFPVAHIAFPLFILSIYDKIRQTKIPGYYFLILGFASMLPDLLSIHIWAEGRTGFGYSIFFPTIFIATYFIFRKRNHLLRDYSILLLLGILSHQILDAMTASIHPLYPFNNFELNQLVIFPATGIIQNGIVYLNYTENAVWYMFDILFFLAFVLVEKTSIVEKIYSKNKV